MIIYEESIIAYINISDNRSSTAEVINSYANLNKIKLQSGIMDAKMLLIFYYEGEDYLLICNCSSTKLKNQFKKDGFMLF